MERCTDWWYTYPSEKYEFVSWDGYSQYMESQKIHVPVTTNQCMDVSQLTHPLDLQMFKTVQSIFASRLWTVHARTLDPSIFWLCMSQNPGSLFNIQKVRGTGQIGCEQLPFWENLASTEAKVEATPSLPKVAPSEVDRQSSIFQGFQCCTNNEVSVLLTNCGSIAVNLLSSSVPGQSTLKHRSGMVTHHPNHSSCMVFALTFTSKKHAHECM